MNIKTVGDPLVDQIHGRDQAGGGGTSEMMKNMLRGRSQVLLLTALPLEDNRLPQGGEEAGSISQWEVGKTRARPIPCRVRN